MSVLIKSCNLHSTPNKHTTVFTHFAKRTQRHGGAKIIGHIKDGIPLSPGGYTGTEAGDQYLKCSHGVEVCLVLPNTENSPFILYVKVQLGGPQSILGRLLLLTHENP